MPPCPGVRLIQVVSGAPVGKARVKAAQASRRRPTVSFILECVAAMLRCRRARRYLVGL